jgi:hypothetical protein
MGIAESALVTVIAVSVGNSSVIFGLTTVYAFLIW